MLDAIARWLWDDEGVLPKLQSWKIRFEDWPRGEARSAAEHYEKLRTEKGHTYAAIRTEEEFDKRLAKNVRLPDEESLRRLYFEAANQATAVELGKMLVKYPERGLELVREARWLEPNGEISHFGSITDKVLDRNAVAELTGKSVIEIPNWPCLSNAIGGFNPGRVGILVADTGFGKTNFAASLALDASSELSTLFCNMEMIPHDFAEKLVMSAGELGYREVKHITQFTRTVYERVQAEHINRRLFFTDGTTLSIWDINQKVVETKTRHGLDLLIVDYDQKIELKTSRETPEWKALQIAVESLESIAKEYEIYVLLLAQAAQDDGKSRGRLSGSRRSTFPASTVMSFYRDEDEDGQPVLVEAVKNRFGPRGVKVRVNYRPEVAKVQEVGIYETQHSHSDPLRESGRSSEAIARPAWYNRDN